MVEEKEERVVLRVTGREMALGVTGRDLILGVMGPICLMGQEGAHSAVTVGRWAIGPKHAMPLRATRLVI